jgi:hypothetical protein
MFSGSQSHREKSQNPVACVASVEETKRMKPTDQALYGRVSESPGRNVREPSGGPDKNEPRRPNLLWLGEGCRMRRRLTEEAHPSGGVGGTAR